MRPSTPTSSPGAGTSPTWYDVLGVDRGASAPQIKQAWREATDKFEPGTGAGQFQMFNQAADVLLDPERRAAYDASLDGGTAGTAGTAGSAAPADLRPEGSPEQPDQPEEQGQPDRPSRSNRSSRWGRWGRRGAPVAAGSAAAGRRKGRADDRADDRDDDRAAGGRERRSSRAPAFLARPARSTPVLVLLALLTVAALTAAVLLGLRVQDAAAAQDARAEAPAAAERAAAAMLSYDYRQLPEDRERAARYLTGGFKDQYLENFMLLEEQADGTPGAAVQSKAVVEATVMSSGVVDVSGSGETVRVLVFVNQVSEKQGADPQIFQNRVQMTMEDVDGRWLVSNLRSY